MRKTLTHLSIAAGALMALAAMTGCSSKQPADLLAEAETAITRGMSGEARALCDKAIEISASDGDATRLSPVDMAKISIIYTKVADVNRFDDGEIMGQAVKAYREAMEEAPDSVEAYMSSLDETDTRHAEMLRNIVSCGEIMPQMSCFDDPGPDDSPAGEWTPR